MSDETEPTTEEQDDTETAAAALTAAGDTEGALKLKLDRAQKALARERGLRRQSELTTVRTTILADPAFKYADPELVTGKTEAELRASAQRAHDAVAKVIAREGLVVSATPKTPEQLAAEATAKAKGDWGAPPPVATEAVTGEAPMDWGELQRAGLTGKDAQGRPVSRADVLKDVAEHGARRMARPTIAGAVMRGRGEPTGGAPAAQ